MKLTLSRRRRTEAGAAAAILATFVAALMIPLCAISVDIGRWYVEAERVQAAADAASTAGVTFMPDDFNSAVARAREIAEDNGFKHGRNATVTVGEGDRPSQLRVTVSTPVRNQFARLLGMGTTNISRSSLSDFTGSAPMGSPCNTFGNEPSGTTNAGPAGSKMITPAGGASCSRTPDFWASINGPDIVKTQGEQFMARKCDNAEDGCDSSKNNTEFNPLGYFYVIRVEQANVPVTLQIYDPASVPTGQQCESRPKWTGANNANDWANTDARARYGDTTATGTYKGSSALCPGDNDMKSSGWSEYATVTSFGLREPTGTQDPVRGNPITSCAKQFKGFTQSQVTSNALTKGNSSYNDKMAQVFHQWYTLCTFTPTQVGDYYLQVRTNVAYNGASSTTISSGNMRIFDQMTDDTSVKGTAVNSFALRAYTNVTGANLSVSAWKSMRIFVNGASAQTTFNLVRVIPAAQGKTLNFGFFDVGEGAGTGASMTLLPPLDSNLSSIRDCVATGFRNQNLPTCVLPISEQFNGKMQNIKATIPSNYTCNWSSMGGCWWRVVVNFNTSAGVHDATTWTAGITGEPVRLIE